MVASPIFSQIFSNIKEKYLISQFFSSETWYHVDELLGQGLRLNRRYQSDMQMLLGPWVSSKYILALAHLLVFLGHLKITLSLIFCCNLNSISNYISIEK